MSGEIRIISKINKKEECSLYFGSFKYTWKKSEVKFFNFSKYNYL